MSDSEDETTKEHQLKFVGRRRHGREGETIIN